MHQKINQAGIDLIKFFEGFEPVAYHDAVGVPTIGYGHTKTVTEKDITRGRAITESEANRLLLMDVREAEIGVDRLIRLPLNANQFSALVSFTFNLGRGALQRSTLRRILNRGDFAAVPAQIVRWNRAGGKVLFGLRRRRAAEAALWNGLDWRTAAEEVER